MNKLVLVSVALGAIAASSSAGAADLPFKAAPRAVAPVAFEWTGVYFGGHIGGGWSTNDFSDPGLGIIGLLLGVPAIQTTDSSGFIGGIQGGWNYQIGRFVIGSELDFSWADVNGTSTTTFAPGIAGPGTSISRVITANTDWTGTSTVRLGYAHDRLMFYSKAGAAFAHTNYTDNWIGNGAGGATLFTGTGGQTRVGWTVGTGVEWAFWNNWSAKIEYDYMDFGSKTVAINGGGASFGVINAQSISEVKFGANYRFMGLP